MSTSILEAFLAPEKSKRNVRPLSSEEEHLKFKFPREFATRLRQCSLVQRWDDATFFIWRKKLLEIGTRVDAPRIPGVAHNYDYYYFTIYRRERSWTLARLTFHEINNSIPSSVISPSNTPSSILEEAAYERNRIEIFLRLINLTQYHFWRYQRKKGYPLEPEDKYLAVGVAQAMHDILQEPNLKELVLWLEKEFKQAGLLQEKHIVAPAPVGTKVPAPEESDLQVRLTRIEHTCAQILKFLIASPDQQSLIKQNEQTNYLP